MGMEVTLGNVLTILIIMLTILVQTTIAVAIISRFMGNTENELKNLRNKYEEFIKTCVGCYLKPKVKNMEQAQTDLRRELPIRLQGIEMSIRDLDIKFDSQKDQLDIQSNDLRKIKDRLKIEEVAA